MKQESYMKFLRLIALCVSLFLWAASTMFSVDGFNIEISDKAWIGYGLALSVTAIQLIWNKAGKNNGPTLYVVGLLAYFYSIYTNIIGIMAMQGKEFSVSSEMIFPLVLGIVLDVTPEPMLVWSLMGFSFGGDLVANLLDMFGQPSQAQPEPRQQQNHNKQQQRPQQQNQQQQKQHLNRPSQSSHAQQGGMMQPNQQPDEDYQDQRPEMPERLVDRHLQGKQPQQGQQSKGNNQQLRKNP